MDPIVPVSTVIRSHEAPQKVIRSVRKIFPDWEPDSIQDDEGGFPTIRVREKISGASNSLDEMLSIIRKNRVLDTALDAMAMKSEDKRANFSLSRQSASIGKVSFVLDNEPLGGTIQVSLVGSDIGLWLEQQTWHSGRDSIPRSIGDEMAMGEEGSPAEWFDSKGRRTMGESD